MAFATYTDMQYRLGVTLDVDEQARATQILADATGLVKQAAGQEIELVTDDVLIRRGVDSNRLRLPQRPVVSVSAITSQYYGYSAQSLAQDQWYLDGDTLVRYGFASWFGPEYELMITYTHGWTTVPIVAKAITLEAALRAWPAQNDVLLTQFEEDRLAKAFRRQQRTMDLT